LTAAGLKAIAVDEGSPDATEHSEAPQPQTKTRASPDEGGDPARMAAPRDVSKLARVIDLLQRSDGATVPNLTEATGWLPHDVGGAHRPVQTHVTCQAATPIGNAAISRRQKSS
jgi:hypothetical protein